MAATGPRSTTVSVAALVSVSSVPLSSVKVARTFSVLPACSGATSQVAFVAPAISLSSVPSLASHWYAKVALSRPSASSMADTDAVSVSPTSAVPEISGRPAGAAFSGSGVSFVTASPAKEAASLPAASWSGAASAPVGTV